VESSDKLKNTFDWLMPPFIQKLYRKITVNWYMLVKMKTALKSGGGHRHNQEKVSELPLFGKTYQQQQISKR
jgi:hypothetical protein